MASRTLSFAVTDWNNIIFYLNEQSQSPADNTTTIAWQLKLTSTSSGKIDSTASKAWWVSVGGQTYSGRNTIGIANNSEKVLASGTTTITHNDDGKKNIIIGFSQEFSITFSGEEIGTISRQAAMELTDMPRASTLTVTNGTLGSAKSITINSASTTLKHRIQYKCGNVSGYVAGSNTGYTTSTSFTWNPPISLAAQNTTGTSVNITFVLGTYESDGSRVGDYYQVTRTFAIPASVAPTCTMTLEDVEGIDDIYGSPVQGLSKIKVTVAATQAQGSPIDSYKIEIDGKQYSTATATTEVLANAGSSPVTVTVTDQRGRKGTASYTMNVQAYERPQITALSVHRVNANYEEDEQGQYFQVTFSANVTSLSSKNTATYKVRYKKTSATSWSTFNASDKANVFTVTNYSTGFAADVDSAYNVEVIATDSHHTTTRSASVSTAFTLMNFHESGTGLSFGRVTDKEDTFENHLKFRQVNNSYAFQPGSFNGQSGYNLLAVITLKELNVNAPIVFTINRRGADCPMTVYVRFASSSSTTDPDLASITYEGSNFGAHLVKAATSTWKLYAANPSYANICLQQWYTTDNQSSRLTVEFQDELLLSLPEPKYLATPVKMQSLLEYIYPVNSIYISYSHTNPGTLFGGTWTRITNAFLWATDASGTIGQTGGEKEHTLTTAELPKHTHGSVYSQNAAGTKTQAWFSTSGDKLAYGTVEAGGGQAHNNMPPYIQVSVWRRTA